MGERQLFILMHSPSRLFYANKTMKIVIILTILELFGSLTNACCQHHCTTNIKESFNANVKVPLGGLLGMRGQMNPVTTDDSFETLAFGVCNSDGVEGLSWV